MNFSSIPLFVHLFADSKLAGRISACMLILAFTSMAPCLAAEKQEFREAHFILRESRPPSYIKATKPDTREKELKISFPVNGGDATGTYRFGSASDYSHGRMIINAGYKFQGTFSGGDGGELRGTFTSLKDGERDDEPVTGTFQADGNGTVKWGKTTFRVTFPPFSGDCCNKNLNSYTTAVRNLLVKELMNAAVPFMHGKLVKLLELNIRAGLDLARKIRSGARSAAWKLAARVSPIELKYADALPLPGFLEDLENAFEEARKTRSAAPTSGIILGMVQNIDKCLSVMQILDAASEGSYGEAAVVAAAEAVGAWSNMAGLAVLVGQAAKEDWDGFCLRNYENQFRNFYRKIYYQGGSMPSEKADRAGQKARLQDFMEECMTWLGDGIGGSQSAQFRKMLIEFAHYRLNLSRNRDDFTVISRKGKKVMSNRADAAVLATLYNDFEQVFHAEIQADRIRKLTISNGKKQKEAVREISGALGDAQRGDFSRVWSKSEFSSVFCPLFHKLEKEGKIKEARALDEKQ
jgi:hypothetical protein